jgi:hypothetical protein
MLCITFKSREISSQEIPNLVTLHMSLEVYAMMEMQQFFPTDNFNCNEDLFGFDACALQTVPATEPSCILPFQNRILHANIWNRVCQTHPEGFTSFQRFQRNSDSCKVTCTQLNTVFNYYIPQYLRTKYLPFARLNEDNIFRYYLYLPSAIKVSRASPSYGFITFIAEVAGWYNLFLGGSVFALWEVLGTKILRALAKIQEKLCNLLSPWRNVFYILVTTGILLYVFIDCIQVLVLNPLGSNTLITNSVVKGLCLSICLPQYTLVADHQSGRHKYVANSSAFWINGTTLKNKILDLIVITHEGHLFSIWNMNQSSTFTQERNLSSIFNIVSSTQSVDFCHTVDLSTVPGIWGVQLRAVNDIYLIVHLSGQLLAAQTKYGVANIATVQTPSTGKSIFLYNSIVNLQLEETSFQNVTTQACKNYNTTWTYDICVMNHAIMVMEGNDTLLRGLLMPSNNSTVQQGIDRAVLQKLYVALLSQNREAVCLPDCRSLIVNMRTETSPTLAQPVRGIPIPIDSYPLPLPPLIVDVNITLPDLSKLTQVIILNVQKIKYG